MDEKEHHVYHIRATLIMFAEIMIAIVIYILQFKHILMLIEMVWRLLTVMLLFGKWRNYRTERKKEDIDE